MRDKCTSASPNIILSCSLWKVPRQSPETAIRLTNRWKRNTGLKIPWGLFVNYFFRTVGIFSSYTIRVSLLASKLQEVFAAAKHVFWDPSSASVFSPDLKVIARCFHRNPETSLKHKSNSICRLEPWIYFNNLLQTFLVSHPQTSNLQKLLNNKDIQEGRSAVSLVWSLLFIKSNTC